MLSGRLKMEKIFRIKSLVSAAVVVLGLVLTGCGSSGGGSSVTSPNGIYSGSITGGNLTFNGLEEKAVIYNNRIMVLSNNSNGVSQIFDMEVVDASVSLAGTGANYSPFPSKLNDLIIDGTFVSGSSASIEFVEQTTGTVTLTPGTINLTASPAIYSKGSDLVRLSGTWSGIYDSGFGKVMTLTINANGMIDVASSIDSNGSSCGFTGTFSLLDSAVNVYSLNLISDGGDQVIVCDLGAGTFSGLAWTEGAADETLVLLTSDGNKARAVVLTKN